MNRADGSTQLLTCLPTKAGSHNCHLSMCYTLAYVMLFKIIIQSQLSQQFMPGISKY
ncbi:MAG: hypothetical protein JWQ30_2523 [Sediminibacterium sp.]|nr:hypothetical protein [Sediminibacterium sp.]